MNSASAQRSSPACSSFILLALAALPLGVSGCALLESSEQYYGDNWRPPSLTSLSATSEAGNLGGGTVTISGAGFGTDPDKVVVQFGDANAEILTITDGVITVVVPPGPLSGGDVTVRVATPTGYSSVPTPYTYDVTELYKGEVGYIQINNFWESCYGGGSSRIEDDHDIADSDIFCGESNYMGYSGIDGQAEALTFAYPRLHAPQIGFYGGSDQGTAEWKIERPGQLSYASNVDELKLDVGAVTLRNEFFAGEEPFCADLSAYASYRYGGGIPGFLQPYAVAIEPYTARGEQILGEQKPACEAGEIEYDMSELRFLSATTADGVPDYVYQADWPIPESFFIDSRRNLKPVAISVSAPNVLAAEQTVTLPEPLVVYGDEGFDAVLTTEDTAGDLWSVSTIQSCFDDNGDGEKLNDTAVSFTWAPSVMTLEEGDLSWAQGGSILGHQTYVRVSVTTISLNWFGPTSYPVRATIVVPDDNEYDRRTGLSRVEIPASVFYQIPTVTIPGGGGGFGGATALSDPARSDWGYLLITVERVTDYTLQSKTDAADTVVFSYTTGDFGFYGWTHPDDQDECHDCRDGDRDGWQDEDDPDCATGAQESGYGNNACNDGIDNDGDGDTDGEDALCEDATGEDESNCSDTVDNDDDGTLDAEDADCIAGGNEGDSEPICDNNLDDDEDGWLDEGDPDCVTGSSEDGFGTTECNDGADNDGDGGIDAADADCVTADGLEAIVTGCANAADDDADGWTDALDPDCLSGTEELGFSTAECNDGADNDGDGGIDTADAECLTADGTEAAVVSLTGCEDGLDEDLDGWIDIEDPDCATGTDEVGFGTNACNDGEDDDGDVLIDRLDLECSDALDDDEGA